MKRLGVYFRVEVRLPLLSARGHVSSMSSSSTSGRQMPGTLLLGIALVAFLALLALDHGRTFNYAGQPTFWDAHVYARAIHAFQTGGDPYARDTPLVFVYPPVFLYGASASSNLISGQTAWYLYLLLNLLAIIAVPVTIAVGYLRSRWFNAGCALLVAAFHPFFTSAFSFFAGNLSNFLYALVLLAGVPGVRRNRWIWFYVAVALAATIKIPMLAFLLLPLLVGEGQAIPCAVAGAAVLIVNAAHRLATPAAYNAYLEAARYQLLVRSDVGFGFFSLLFRLTHRSAHLPHLLPYVAHGLIFGSLAGALWWARRRGVPKELGNWWVSLVLLLAVLCNPRMLAYDIDLIVVVTAFLLVEMVRACVVRRVPSLLLTGCGLAAIIALAKSPLYAYYLLAVACFPIAGYLWLTSHSPAREFCCPEPVDRTGEASSPLAILGRATRARPITTT